MAFTKQTRDLTIADVKRIQKAFGPGTVLHDADTPAEALEEALEFDTVAQWIMDAYEFFDRFEATTPHKRQGLRERLGALVLKHPEYSK